MGLFQFVVGRMLDFGVRSRYFCHRHVWFHSPRRARVWIHRMALLDSISIPYKPRARIHTVRLVHWDSTSKSRSASERPPWKRDCLRDREVPRPVPLTIYPPDDAAIYDRLGSRPGHCLAGLVPVGSAISD